MAEIVWILFLSVAFPSDAVLLDFCNWHVPMGGHEIIGVVGHVSENDNEYTVFLRLRETADRGRETIEPMRLIHLENDHWLVLADLQSGKEWLELKVRE